MFSNLSKRILIALQKYRVVQLKYYFILRKARLFKIMVIINIKGDSLRFFIFKNYRIIESKTIHKIKFGEDNL